MNGPHKRPKRSTTTMTGRWDIIDMDELDYDYFDLGDQPPYQTITPSGTENVRGEYAIGLSTGSLDGALRDARAAEKSSLSSVTQEWTRWSRSTLAPPARAGEAPAGSA